MIVLARQPYREHALLLSGLSPDYGRLDLTANGALRLSEKKFPAADLFRELEVEFDDSGSSDLHTARRLELATSFDAVAETPRHFQFAGRIGRFLLRNAAPNMPMPYTYDALRSILVQLSIRGEVAGKWTLEQCAVVLKTTYLYENGLLPDAASAEQNDFLENLVAAGVENTCLPEVPAEYWKSLNNWLNSLLEFHGLPR